jgi:excisionase family DNA binding protein
MRDRGKIAVPVQAGPDGYAPAGAGLEPDESGELAAAPAAPFLYKIGEACALLRLSRSEIYEQVRAGRIKAVHQGRAVRFTPAALRAYVTLLVREAAEDAADA